jgi:hypothetical protein
MSIVRGAPDNDLGRRGCLLPHDFDLLLTIGSCSANKWWSVPLAANAILSTLFPRTFVIAYSQERELEEKTQ